MKNPEAADVLREYIRTNRPCNGLEMALQKAITALEHQPEPQHVTRWDKVRDFFECTCGATFSDHWAASAHEENQGQDVSEIGRKA